MTCFAIDLEARSPEANHWRAYSIQVGPDLFGDWLVDVTFGRIGRPGQSKRYVALSEEEAVQQTRALLKRRLSAPKRIGVAYQCRRLIDPEDWLSEGPLFSPCSA